MSAITRFIIFVLFFVLLLGPMVHVPAFGQEKQLCVSRAEFISRLSERYNESVHSLGLDANGTVLEVFTSPKGSWTILVTRPDGVSCVVTTGEAWQDITPASPDTEA